EVFTYDAAGNLFTFEEHSGDASSPVTSSSKSTYDAQGNQLTLEEHETGDLDSPVTKQTIYTNFAPINQPLAREELVQPSYGFSTGNTTFDDACNGGTMHMLVDDGSNFGSDDEGFTATTIDSPVNFSFFGFIEPKFRVSTNGWLSFGLVTRAALANFDMPHAGIPNSVIAPFWDDLENLVICTKMISGSRLVVQWSGNVFGAPTETVSFQTILDGADNNIEFVWGPTHVPDGRGEFATVGIEDQAAFNAKKRGFNTPNTTPTGTSLKFRPR
ncbi:MAG TPA: hypothetical protein DF383_13635, partial [Deltaproteobacteria bacterium]|nr:hypothetical protein [Deltaproteobacteria bacterium]